MSIDKDKNEAGSSLDKYVPKRTESMTSLHIMTANELKALEGSVLIRKFPDEKPVVVLVPFDQFMDMLRMILNLEKEIAQKETDVRSE